MKAHSPAFQFYPKDWLSDENVRMMSHEEKGVYIDLLAHCWVEGSIPADILTLLGLLGIHDNGVLNGLPGCGDRFDLSPILRCFLPSPEDPERLIHPRLERERQIQEDFREAKSRAGKASAKARKNTGKNKGQQR